MSVLYVEDGDASSRLVDIEEDGVLAGVGAAEAGLVLQYGQVAAMPCWHLSQTVDDRFDTILHLF